MNFVEVFKVNEIKEGGMKPVAVGGKVLTIAQSGGRYYAFDDECTHRACSLAEGFLIGGIVECPCHGGKFDVATGEALALPATAPVKVYPVKTEDGKILVQI